MEKIGLYGGTFNPPHIGHIRAAECAVKALGLDRLLLIPAYIAPHKNLPEDSASAQQRLDMLRIAAREIPGVEVCDLELKRQGVSYTWQTVEALAEQYPDAELTLFMGTDMFLSFRSWKEVPKITAKAGIGVFCRGEKKEKQKIRAEKELLESMGVSVVPVENDVVPISSTDIRRLCAFGCADAFLPEGVMEYIRENGLYDSRADFRNLPMEQLESTVVRLLNPNRVAHVLGCRDTSAELAARWGANVTDAARAGMLHDVTKALPGHLQLALCKAYGVQLSEFAQENPKTLHALTGSLVAERIFGENKAVVDAICSHTTGKADMNLLEKIIYVADYMEPNRDFPGVEKLRELTFTDMDAALQLGLEMTLEHLKEQGSVVSPESAEALAFLRAQQKG